MAFNTDMETRKNERDITILISDKETIQRTLVTVSVTCPRRYNSINGCPVSQKVWHANKPSLLNGHECLVKVKPQLKPSFHR